MKNDPIYVITTIIGNDIMDREDSRCVGFCHELIETQYSVVNNLGDMHESWYKYVVIEEKFPGINCTNNNQWWYVWDNSKYISCECPESYKNVINFGIG